MSAETNPAQQAIRGYELKLAQVAEGLHTLRFQGPHERRPGPIINPLRQLDRQWGEVVDLTDHRIGITFSEGVVLRLAAEPDVTHVSQPDELFRLRGLSLVTRSAFRGASGESVLEGFEDRLPASWEAGPIFAEAQVTSDGNTVRWLGNLTFDADGSHNFRLGEYSYDTAASIGQHISLASAMT